MLVESLESRLHLDATFSASTGELIVNGTSGNDKLVVFSSSTTQRKVQINNVDIQIKRTSTSGTVSNVVSVSTTELKKITMNGLAGNDEMMINKSGQAGDAIKVPCTLRGGTGSDILIGGEGNDLLDGGFSLTSGQDDDTIDGRGGNDTADYSTHPSTAPITADFDNEADDGCPDLNPATRTKEPERDNITRTVENIIGTNGPDKLFGSSASNKIEARGGNDFIQGYNDEAGDIEEGSDLGTDSFLGGDGNDVIDCSRLGTTAPKTLDGGNGNDRMYGATGNDKFLGGAGDDWMRGAGGADSFDGGEGSETNGDTVDYADRFPGPAPSDSKLRGVIVTLDNVANDGERDSDPNISSKEGDNVKDSVENVVGSHFADIIIGSSDRNRLEGLEGDDQITGNSGIDILIGGFGSDTLIGGSRSAADTSADQIFGDGFNVTFPSGSGGGFPNSDKARREASDILKNIESTF